MCFFFFEISMCTRSLLLTFTFLWPKVWASSSSVDASSHEGAHTINQETVSNSRAQRNETRPIARLAACADLMGVIGEYATDEDLDNFRKASKLSLDATNKLSEYWETEFVMCMKKNRPINDDLKNKFAVIVCKYDDQKIKDFYQ